MKYNVFEITIELDNLEYVKLNKNPPAWRSVVHHLKLRGIRLHFAAMNLLKAEFNEFSVEKLSRLEFELNEFFKTH